MSTGLKAICCGYLRMQSRLAYTVFVTRTTIAAPYCCTAPSSHTTFVAHAGWLEGQPRRQQQHGVTCCLLSPEATLPPDKSLPWLWQQALVLSPQPAVAAMV